MERIRSDNWSAGANNVASRDRLPPNSVREAINLDPLPGGRLALRIGYQRIYIGAAVRGVLSLRNRLLIADGADLVEYSIDSNSSRVIRQITDAGPFVGTVLNGRLYFCTADECLEYDDDMVRPWGVPDVLFQPFVASGPGGTLLAGNYSIAVTYTDRWGREGGTDRPVIIAASSGGLLSVQVDSIPAGCTANIYAGQADGATLYRQGSLSVAGSFQIGAVRDDLERCTTILMRAPSPGHLVSRHNGVIGIAAGRVVQCTVPMRPHLIDRVRGFFQYPSKVGLLLSAAGVLFVGSDRVYSLATLETSEVQQGVAMEHSAVAGTGVLLPDGRGAWMTRYGLAIASIEGVQLINRQSFAPVESPLGTAGLIDHNGNQLFITALTGINRPNPLASTDTFIGEVMNP